MLDMTITIDVSDVNNLVDRYSDGMIEISRMAMVEVIEFSKELLIQELPKASGVLRESLRTVITFFGVASNAILIGSIFIGNRSRQRVLPEDYGSYVESGTDSNPNVPLFPLHEWTVSKLGLRGESAWKVARGIQKKIVEQGIKENPVWQNFAIKYDSHIVEMYKLIIEEGILDVFK